MSKVEVKDKKHARVSVRMTGDRVLVRPLEPEDRTPGGIVLPDSASTPTTRGIVVATGPGRWLSNGTREVLDIAPGETVTFPEYTSTNKVEIDGEQYLVLAASDILFVG